MVSMISSFAFAEVIFSPSDLMKYGYSSSTIINGETKLSFSPNGINDFNEILKTARTEYCKLFQACAEEQYVNRAIIGNLIIGSKTQPITDKEYSDTIESKSVSGLAEELITVEIDLSDTYKYTISTYHKYMTCVVGFTRYEVTPASEGKAATYGYSPEYGIIPKKSARQYQNITSPDGTVYNTWSETQVSNLIFEGQVAENSVIALQKLADAVRVGLVAGSVGSGYNVGTVYSDTQLALSSIMEIQDNGYYDFKNGISLKSSFEYYMNPLLGRVNFLSNDSVSIPKTVDEWTSFVEKEIKEKDFVQGNDIVLNPEFDSFESSLLDDGRINSMGLKKTNNVNFSNGVTAVTGIGTSKRPKSVITYNMQIVLPYVFYKSSGDKYKLDMSQLRLLDGYTYCITNDYMYSSINNVIGEVVGSIKTLELNRDALFLYKYETGNGVVGAILVGQFHEGIIDPKNKVTYVTGRNIAFNNGYSDLLDLNNANVNLMYSIGSLSNQGRSGYIPRNVAFTLSDSEEATLRTYQEAIKQGVLTKKQTSNTVKGLSLSNEMSIYYVEDSSNHQSVESPSYFKILIGFTNIENNETSLENENISLNQDETEKMGFIIYRNNKYVNDADLLTWLRSNEAHSIAYVNADTLISKITGDFTGELEPISHETWEKMKEMRSYIEWKKNNAIISALNVGCIVISVLLISYSVLMCLAYWIDIFNTFSQFSLLNIMTFGYLYSVESRDEIPYSQTGVSNTHYVTFKDVLLRAFFMLALGLLLMELDKIVYFIIVVYQYIMYVFSLL